MCWTTEVSTVDVVNKQATLITKTSLQPFVVTDLYVKSENWDSRNWGGERKREQTEKKKKKSREEAADQSWVPTEITLFIHIKSFLNMDSREQSGSLSALRLWLTLHWHAPALHLQYSDCIKANTTTVSGHVWGEVRSMALAKTRIQNNKKSLYSKHVLFKHNLIWAAVQRSLLRDRVPVVIVRKAHVYLNLIN